MAGSRTLKLSILAETKDLVSGLNKASAETESFGNKATEFGKKAALAFAVAGAAALKFGFDAVKAATEDAAAQALLAKTIEATTSATAAQVKGVEDYITKTSIAIGVTDDELRPAFSRLVRSTKDTEEAQRLLNLALDLSAASGKPLELVTNALGKAYDGNTTALGKLGLGLDTNLLKSKDNDAIIRQLETTYGEFAEGAAETAAKKFERIKIATDEAKESIGAALLPVIEQLSDFVLTTAVPNLQSFIQGLTGEGSLEEASKNATDGAYNFGQQIKSILKTVVAFKTELIVLTAVIAGVFVGSKIAAGVTATILLINGLIKAYNLLKASSIVAGVASAFALNPLLGVGAVALAASVLSAANALAGKSNTAEADLPGVSGGGGFSGTMPNGKPFVSGSGVAGAGAGGATTGGATTGGTSTRTSTSTIPKIAVPIFDSGRAGNYPSSGFPGSDTSFDPNRVGMTSGGATINLTVNGAIDKEGTARTIIDTLNNSFYRGTGGAGNFVVAT
jgi:pheromone shutdown protein TraB